MISEGTNLISTSVSVLSHTVLHLLYLPGMPRIFVAGDADGKTLADRITDY